MMFVTTVTTCETITAIVIQEALLPLRGRAMSCVCLYLTSTVQYTSTRSQSLVISYFGLRLTNAYN